MVEQNQSKWWLDATWVNSACTWYKDICRKILAKRVCVLETINANIFCRQLQLRPKLQHERLFGATLHICFSGRMLILTQNMGTYSWAGRGRAGIYAHSKGNRFVGRTKG